MFKARGRAIAGHSDEWESPSPRSPSPAPTLNAVSEEEYNYLLKEEKAAYHELVSHGGRPWYPLHMLDAVSRNPWDHHRLLRFWDPLMEDDGWNVYTKQWERWQQFLLWQQNNRGMLDPKADLDNDRALMAKYHERTGTTPLHGDDDEEWWANQLQSMTAKRAWQHRTAIEEGLWEIDDQDRFPAYIVAMHARLDRHWLPCQADFHPDPKQQSALATWVEYLAYECWVHDGFADKAAELQPRHDALAEAIRDANALLAGETPEFIAEAEQAFLREKGKSSALLAGKLAMQAASAAHSAFEPQKQKANRSPPKAALSQAKKSSAKTRRAAKAAVKKRCELLIDLESVAWSLEMADESAENHQLLLVWIAKQFPLIEAEMAEAQAKPGSASQHGAPERPAAPKPTTRKRTRGGDGGGGTQNGKRRKPNTQDRPRRNTRGGSGSPTAAAAGGKTPSSRSKRPQPRPRTATTAQGAGCPPVRRSARIAAVKGECQAKDSIAVAGAP